MNKSEAIQIFGRTAADLARALGVTPSAVSQWPTELRQDQVDRVLGAAVRLGRIPVTVTGVTESCVFASDQQGQNADARKVA